MSPQIVPGQQGQEVGMLNRARPCVLAAAVCMALANASASAALPTRYVYTGSTYDSINPYLYEPDPSPYTTSMRQTWTLDLDDAIPADSVGFVADGHIQSFLVEDGVYWFVPSPNAIHSNDHPHATFSTDSAGQIVAWDAWIGGELSMRTVNPSLGLGIFDWTNDDLSAPYVTSASPGKWAIATVPEPDTAALVTIGLLGIAGLRRAMSRSVLNV